MKGLTTRIITAIVFVLVILGGLYGGKYTFTGVFGVIALLCLWEFLDLTLPNKGFRKVFGIFLGMLPFVLISLYQFGVIPASGLPFLTILIVPLIFLVFLFELYTASERPFENIAFIVLSIVYLGLPFMLLSLIAIDKMVYYPNIIFGMLLLTWANDTFAYFVGSKFGKTPLFPRISPKKTWEGSLGGVLGTFLVGYAISYFFPILNLTQWLTLAGIVAIFGAMGDLVESMLKRSLQVKDSGNLLPGHGGFLDRFDAFIFLIPFAATYLLWIR